MKTLLIVALIVTGALAVGQGNMRPSFSDFDLNKDGQVLQAEFEKAQQDRMTQRAEEGRLMRNAGNAPTFDSIDLNKDGQIDQKEFKDHQLSNQKCNCCSKRGMGRGQGMNR